MARSIGLLALASVLVVGAPQTLQAGQRALLIGVNDYEYGGEVWDLRGCVNDVHMTRQLLIDRFGFDPADIMVLVDQQATAHAIVAAIEDWLIAGTGPEDVAYLHFSGHGSQVPDEDGDEADGWDEMLCPTDLRPTDRSTMILDDDLKRLIERIPAASLTTVLDACHSGTGTRDFNLSRPRYLPLDVRAPEGASRTRGLAPADPQTILTSFYGDSGSQAPSAMEAVSSSTRTRVTISGCKADQTSADAWIRDDFYAGALTSNLVANARRAPAGTTYGELIENVRRDMAGKYYQTPQLEGNVDAPLFSVADGGGGNPAVAAVSSVSGQRVRISVGWAHGVTPGSVFDVFSAAVDDGAAAAELTVDRIEQDWSEGTLTRGTAAAPGDRVVRRSHGVSLDPVSVRLECPDEELRRALRDGLGDLEFVRVAAPEEHYDLRLAANREAGALSAGLLFDGVPRIRETAGSVPALIDRLRPHLANTYIIERLGNLVNPAPPFRVDLRAARAAGGDPSLAAGRGAKVVHARIGDEIRFRFTVERDCYVTLVNVGTSGRVTVLFPNEHRPDGRVQAGQVYETGTAGVMPFRIRAAGPPGRELVKAVATLEPLDLTRLGLPTSGARSMEAGERFADGLVRDMAAVYTGAVPPQGDPGPSEQVQPPTVGWSTDHVIVETTH